ncbi:MAG: hypothetical protein R2991_12100 [Thermoanaerobaculia bacterium]
MRELVEDGEGVGLGGGGTRIVHHWRSEHRRGESGIARVRPPAFSVRR